MVFKECLENNSDIYIWERVTRLRQKLHFRTVLLNTLSLGDDKDYCTSLPQFFRVLKPHPLRNISAVDSGAWMCNYSFPFVTILFFFETLKKSTLCQRKGSAVGLGDLCQPTAQMQSGCTL